MNSYRWEWPGVEVKSSYTFEHTSPVCLHPGITQALQWWGSECCVMVDWCPQWCSSDHYIVSKSINHTSNLCTTTYVRYGTQCHSPTTKCTLSGPSRIYIFFWSKLTRVITQWHISTQTVHSRNAP